MGTIRRQITACSQAADVVQVSRSRRRGRPVLWELFVCTRHVWVANEWGSAHGRQPVEGAETACGLLLDHREPEEVFQSHSDVWLLSLTAATPEDHDGDWAATLHAAAGMLHQPPTFGGRIAELLRQAAGLAEQIPGAGELGEQAVRRQVLSVLAVAETLATTARQKSIEGRA